MIQIIEGKVVKKTEVLTEVSSIDIQYQIKSIDEAIESMQIAKEVYLKDLEIILELEKQINEISQGGIYFLTVETSYEKAVRKIILAD